MQSIRDNVSGEVAIILIGNKMDMPDRIISVEEGQAMAKEFDVDYFETSAKSGEGVESTFMSLATRIIDNKDKIMTTTGGVAVAKKKEKPKSRC
jgi:Ras-related protein Rab-8A